MICIDQEKEQDSARSSQDEGYLWTQCSNDQNLYTEK